ncbi:hypothetical protein Ciccas_002717 [Cichlidogyrus casuarinus]|uniref:Uncharacterized protein n=1 Tax=Cichlidogyrus casuarinus TaxID=1844966 RepID=A0ABD2QH22_9PLAT
MYRTSEGVLEPGIEVKNVDLSMDEDSNDNTFTVVAALKQAFNRVAVNLCSYLNYLSDSETLTTDESNVDSRSDNSWFNTFRNIIQVASEQIRKIFNTFISIDNAEVAAEMAKDMFRKTLNRLIQIIDCFIDESELPIVPVFEEGEDSRILAQAQNRIHPEDSDTDREDSYLSRETTERAVLRRQEKALKNYPKLGELNEDKQQRPNLMNEGITDDLDSVTQGKLTLLPSDVSMIKILTSEGQEEVNQIVTDDPQSLTRGEGASSPSDQLNIRMSSSEGQDEVNRIVTEDPNSLTRGEGASSPSDQLNIRMSSSEGQDEVNRIVTEDPNSLTRGEGASLPSDETLIRMSSSEGQQQVNRIVTENPNSLTRGEGAPLPSDETLIRMSSSEGQQEVKQIVTDDPQSLTRAEGGSLPSDETLIRMSSSEGQKEVNQIVTDDPNSLIDEKKKSSPESSLLDDRAHDEPVFQVPPSITSTLNIERKVCPSEDERMKSVFRDAELFLAERSRAFHLNLETIVDSDGERWLIAPVEIEDSTGKMHHLIPAGFVDDDGRRVGVEVKQIVDKNGRLISMIPTEMVNKEGKRIGVKPTVFVNETGNIVEVEVKIEKPVDLQSSDGEQSPIWLVPSECIDEKEKTLSVTPAGFFDHMGNPVQVKIKNGSDSLSNESEIVAVKPTESEILENDAQFKKKHAKKESDVPDRENRIKEEESSRLHFDE